MRTWLLAGVAAAWLVTPACTHHTVHIDPVNVKIEPIEIKMEITIKVIDHELDKFFAFQEQAEKKGDTEEKKAP